MGEHTKGPWKAYEASERCPFPVGVIVEVGTEAGKGAKTGTICEMVGQGDRKYDPATTCANGFLIAASPDLLASLEEIVQEWGYPNTPKWHRANAAIAKARGKA